MTASIRLHNLTLDVPAFFQRDRDGGGWAKLFAGAAFDPPERRVVRLLHDISLEIGEGDRVGILGRNGAGKSTLLRVLNGVYQPTSGTVSIEGSCQALLNMSLGFNGYATVRENIVLRGVAMGLTARFLREHAGPILEFAGLQSKATHLLRTLSSGQKLRLGFAISTVAQHDIILMDEWVGTGDSEFMARAKDRMRNRVGGSKIVVLASHSTGLLRSICNKGIVLEGGRLVFSGGITQSLAYYHDLMASVGSGEDLSDFQARQSKAQVFGAIERIELDESCGQFQVTGWMVDGRGGMPAILEMEWRGLRSLASDFQRRRRPDVKMHFGLTGDEYGFVARIQVPGIESIEDLRGSSVRFLGGQAGEQPDAPLRLAAEVMALLGMEEGVSAEPSLQQSEQT